MSTKVFYNKKPVDNSLPEAYLMGEAANYAGVAYEDAPEFETEEELKQWQKGWDDAEIDRMHWEGSSEDLYVDDTPPWYNE